MLYVLSVYVWCYDLGCYDEGWWWWYVDDDGVIEL